MNALGLRETKLHPSPKSKEGIVILRYGGNKQVSRIYHLLYDEATMYLPRKRDIVRPHVRSVSGHVLLNVAVDAGKLRALKDRHKLGIAKLARAAGLNRNTVAGLMAGKHRAHPATVERLAETLGVEPSELVDEG